MKNVQSIFCLFDCVQCSGKASANGSVPCKEKPSAEPAPDSTKKPEETKKKKGSVDDGQGLIIARDFLSLSKAVTEALKSTGYLPDINGIASGVKKTHFTNMQLILSLETPR